MRIFRGDESHVYQIMELWKEFMEYHQRIDAYYGTVEGGQIKFGEYLRGRMSRTDSLVLVAVVRVGRQARVKPQALCCQRVAPKVWVAMAPRAEVTRPRGNRAAEATAVILAVLKQRVVAEATAVFNQRVARKLLEEP